MKNVRGVWSRARVARLFVLCVCASMLCSCDARKYKLAVEELHVLGAAGEPVRELAELAIRPDERQWGFMERRSIPDGTGMLFVFERDERRSFWMKNTPHPLSIAYIGSDGIIYDILDMEPFSEASVRSSRSVRFALEVPQGWFERAGVRPGDSVVRQDGSPLTTIR